MEGNGRVCTPWGNGNDWWGRIGHVRLKGRMGGILTGTDAFVFPNLKLLFCSCTITWWESHSYSRVCVRSSLNMMETIIDTRMNMN